MAKYLLALFVSLAMFSAASAQESIATFKEFKKQVAMTIREIPEAEQNRLLDGYVEMRNLAYAEKYSGELTFNPDNSALITAVFVDSRDIDGNDPDTLVTLLKDAMRESCGSEFQLTLQAAGFTQRIVFFDESYEIFVGVEIPALRSKESTSEIHAENIRYNDLDCVREYGWQKSVFSGYLNDPDLQDERCFWSNRLWFSDETTVDLYGARRTDFTRRTSRMIRTAENAFCKD